jgi:UDP-2,3-diacylglucosamine hydrolase
VIALEPGTCVVGDLHLDVAPGAGPPQSFLDWLASLRGAPRLIVLGDLFDAWIGPLHLELPAAAAAVRGLRELADSRTGVELLLGNRDFLLERRFELESGARLHPGGLLAELPGGSRALFVHGDELCTQDLGYQRLKRVVRSRPFAWVARHQPRALSLWFARRLRARSQSAVPRKSPAHTAHQPEAARTLALRAGAEHVVCGHAHRFRREALPQGPTWWVLDAWGGERDLLRVRAGAGEPFEVARTGFGPPAA